MALAQGGFLALVFIGTTMGTFVACGAVKLLCHVVGKSGGKRLLAFREAEMDTEIDREIEMEMQLANNKKMNENAVAITVQEIKR